MKKYLEKVEAKSCALVAKAALSVTKLNVNTACCFLSHQEKLPKGAEKLRKMK